MDENVKKMLNETYQKTDELFAKQKRLEKEKEAFEILFEQDENFKKYFNILNELNSINKDIDNRKSLLYDAMLLGEEQEYKGNNVNIKLKKPYFKREFNSEAFYEDFDPKSRMYKKYVTEKEVKGNIIIKRIDG